MVSNLSLRTAHLEDAADIAHLLDQLDYPGANSFIQTRLLQLMRHPEALLIVAVDNSQRLIGFISAHFIPQLALAGDFCRISYFCVEPQSRSLGVGRLLETFVVEEAKKRECDRIEVHCHTRRKRAHRFYFQQGYIESPKYLVKTLAL